jgi:hypothetical protein
MALHHELLPLYAEDRDTAIWELEPTLLNQTLHILYWARLRCRPGYLLPRRPAIGETRREPLGRPPLAHAPLRRLFLDRQGPQCSALLLDQGDDRRRSLIARQRPPRRLDLRAIQLIERRARPLEGQRQRTGLRGP